MKIKETIQKITESQDVIFKEARPEYKVELDEYPSPRQHDLGIWANTDAGKKIFIGLEAKVIDRERLPIQNLETRYSEILKEPYATRRE